ncbi:LOW QUALITY PROTEIN: hypothetical protein KUTeg_023717 [Tegillarca granosa]|uniref:Uncharacterized protein n=1 Tax=Tegillarca granosa TaxID=220873 RepID=A0ABQ9E702_TEGGR|nr:LOW QUALITY PROTEIN: hypothetical protein KUTeg_023717 [Tegillarca granosa]
MFEKKFTHKQNRLENIMLESCSALYFCFEIRHKTNIFHDFNYQSYDLLIIYYNFFKLMALLFLSVYLYINKFLFKYYLLNKEYKLDIHIDAYCISVSHNVLFIF